MKPCLNIQIQRIQASKAIGHIETLLHVVSGQTEVKITRIAVDYCFIGDYCNIFVESNNGEKLWSCLAIVIAENPEKFVWLRKRWIVILQGKSGWDDYLLLAHFKPSVHLDPINRPTKGSSLLS
ncbi:hypothetical protein ACEN8I_01120 [Polaromonas sp. CT11-55]|uniref:hypothetical protein n=1 Tax=Polaromonas sp. CT11-55 TaxID=3243045 RepID=UPI0039A4DC38